MFVDVLCHPTCIATTITAAVATALIFTGPASAAANDVFAAMTLLPPHSVQTCTLYDLALTANGTAWGINENTNLVYRCDDLATSGVDWTSTPTAAGTSAAQVVANDGGLVLYRSIKDVLFASTNAGTSWKQVSGLTTTLHVCLQINLAISTGWRVEDFITNRCWQPRTT